MRLEIMTKESELRRAHDKIDNLEREIQEVGCSVVVVVVVVVVVNERTGKLYMFSFFSCE